VHVAVLLDASVAVQVTVVVPTGNCTPDGGLQLTVVPGQLSVATGVVKLAAALVAKGHEACAVTVTAAGQPFGNTGACASIILTMKLQVPVLLEASLAVQLTVVVPTGKNEPVAGEHIMTIWFEAVQLSVADGVP
jgi:hypothetical protein